MNDDREETGISPQDEAVEKLLKDVGLDPDHLKRQSGVLSRTQKEGQGGVLHRAMTAAGKDEDCRQELKTCFFKDERQQELWLAAYNERVRYGCNTRPLVDWLVAKNAGTNGARIRMVIDGLTHTSISTNTFSDKKKGRDNPTNQSPLS